MPSKEQTYEGSENFYQAIEQLPFVPLSVKYQVKDQMLEMEKAIRTKRKKNEAMATATEKLKEEFKEQFERKKKLKKAAKEIILLERAQEKENERINNLEMGLEGQESSPKK